MTEINIRLQLDLPPCKSRLGGIRRARDRPKSPTGPLKAPRGVRCFGSSFCIFWATAGHFGDISMNYVLETASLSLTRFDYK